MAKLPAIKDLISLEAKHALITGAASGIGRAIAHRLAEAGAKLSLVDIDKSKLLKTKSELSALSYQVETYVVDLSSKSEIDLLWDNLRGNEPDILVNNAGIYPFKPLLDVDEEFYRKNMSVNLDSVLWMSQNMIRSRKKIGGTVINVASIEALLPFKDDLAVYSSGKAAVIALTRALAKEHAKHGFKVNVIVPGGIITSGTKSAAKQVLKGNLGLVKSGIEFKQRLPIGRMGQADEVARMVLVLASDLSSYVHGAVITVDGGFLSA